jgi:hypothetical protein
MVALAGGCWVANSKFLLRDDYSSGYDVGKATSGSDSDFDRTCRDAVRLKYVEDPRIDTEAARAFVMGCWDGALGYVNNASNLAERLASYGNPD